ncbi:MAG: hypothetical protein K2W82_15285 [Candidatus Obscuribacterales bacterium]|nr:hypothetical protein [Candidatus Obscuribacterales bacterium]
MEKEYGARVGSCKRCKKRIWLTGGTFFNHIRAAKPWLLAIWLIEQRIIISSSRFHRLAGVAQSSAHNIFKKITTVSQSHMQENTVEVSSALFSLIFCKRSRETQARKHPLSEQEEMEKQSDSEILLETVSDCYTLEPQPETTTTTDMNFEGLEKEIYDQLSTEPIHVDTLSHKTGMPANKISVALTMLELAGVAIRLAGDRYIKRIAELGKTNNGSYPAVSDETANTVDSIVSFIRNRFHGISRKCLQNYLAVYWSAFSKIRWQHSFLEACWYFGPISPQQIFASITPLRVQILHSNKR